MKHHPRLLALLLALIFPTAAWSQTADEAVSPPTIPAPVPPATPQPVSDRPASWLVHSPRMVVPAGTDIELTMDILHPERVRRIEVHYRVAQDPWQSLTARRGSEAAYIVTVPSPPLDARELDYYITVTSTEGSTRAAFASESAPHVVVLRPNADDFQEATELAQNHGNRLEFTGGGEYTSLGSIGCNGALCADNWYDVYGMVRYHFFRLVRSVAVRVDDLAGNTAVNGLPTAVGLKAATAEVEFRLMDTLSLHLFGILGANQDTVQVGGGGSVEIGVGSPTGVELAFRGITDYGLVGSAWMRFDLVHATPFGVGLELTTEPGNGAPAERLLFEVGRRFGRHVTVMARGGYGARLETAGGFTGGGSVMFGF